MNADTLNRLHDLRCLSQDLRRIVEKDKAWQVAVHLAAAETEFTEAIAFVNLCGERTETAAQPSVFVCEGCALEYCDPQSICAACGSRLVVKSPATLSQASKTNAS